MSTDDKAQVDALVVATAAFVDPLLTDQSYRPLMLSGRGQALLRAIEPFIDTPEKLANIESNLLRDGAEYYEIDKYISHRLNEVMAMRARDERDLKETRKRLDSYKKSLLAQLRIAVKEMGKL